LARAKTNPLNTTFSFETTLIWMGSISLLAGQTIKRMFSGGVEFGEIVHQIKVLGIKSLTIVSLTAVFSGAVMGLQFGMAMGRFGAREMVGQVVSMAILRELGPVLTALLVGGRIGSGMAAELGSMRVTEQIDAIRILGADPITKLIVPRVLATVIISPLLTIWADLIGVLGGAVVANTEFGVGYQYYYQSVFDMIEIADFVSGVSKSVFFGFLVSLIACHEGFNTRGGTEGVGHSTTRTVVLLSIITLIADFMLTKIFLML